MVTGLTIGGALLVGFLLAYFGWQEARAMNLTFAMPTMDWMRWRRDKEEFAVECEELGAVVVTRVDVAVPTRQRQQLQQQTYEQQQQQSELMPPPPELELLTAHAQIELEEATETAALEGVSHQA